MRHATLPIAPFAATLLVIGLAACQASQPGAGAAGQTPAGTDGATDTASAPPPAPAQPAQPATPPGSGLARYDGYGDMRFGMTEAEARKGWGGDLNGATGGEGCHYLNPVWANAPSYFAFMFDGGKFVRYDVGNDKEIAPGGGRRGMTASQIEALYPDRIASSPHKYVDGGRYLRIKADDGSDGVLVFETDASGKVTEWHAGLAPQVDYIEGCS
jgi:hypothetical protein